MVKHRFATTLPLLAGVDSYQVQIPRPFGHSFWREVRNADKAKEIDSFQPSWQKVWYVYNENGNWPYRTNKIQDPR